MSDELKALADDLRKLADAYEEPFKDLHHDAFLNSQSFTIVAVFRELSYALDRVQHRQTQ